MFNTVFGVATLATKRVDPTMHHVATRFYFAQFWCEFTKEVLTEFLEEDYSMKE